MSTRENSTRVHTLGTFKVLREGDALPFSTKAQRKPLALLKTLVALGGERVPEQSLTDILWPDSDGDAAHSAFTTTLHRLRKLIGHSALAMREGRLSLDAGHCWVDLLELRGRLAAASRARERGDAGAMAEELSRALDLYQGPFLEGEFDPPEVLSMRQRLHAEFLRHVGEAGGWLWERGEQRAVLALFRRAIELDDLAEEFYQRLMRAYLELGRHAEGLAIYERCRTIFQAKGGIALSKETEVLHDKLREHEAAARPSAPLPAIPAQTARAPATAERRRISVLCLAWDAPRKAGIDPEDAEQLATLLRERIDRAIEAQGGVVNQYLPSQCVAVFGLPAAHEDDPVRAVRAAHAICGEAERGVHGCGGHGVSFRAGIASGVALARSGEGTRGRFAVAGEPVERAATLCARAPAGMIWIDADTSRLTAGYFETECTIAPESDAREVYQVKAETPARSAFEAAERRGLTPFVGRGAELAALESALARTLAGEGQFVTVVGEAGLGKSRLVHEFKRRIERERVTVTEGRCQSYGGSTPYLPLLDALRHSLQLGERDSPADLHRKAVANLLAVEPRLAPQLPLCLRLLSIPSAEYPLPANLQGEALRRALEEALTATVAASARRRPLVLIYEDWHWVDEASEAALGHLLGLIPEHPMLLVVLYRPEYRPRWGEIAQHRPIILKSLEPEDTASILAHRLAVQRLPDALAARVHARTGGNPFFVEETAQALRERVGAGAGGPEQEVLRGELDRLGLPTTVEATIRSRVDRLDPDARDTLRLAAVIGREFNRRVLEAIHHAPERTPRALASLRDLDLIRQARVLPEPKYLFKHVLTQAAVYEGILQSERKALHAAVGQAIESLFADRLEEHFEALAHHYAHSEDSTKAIEYLEKAGDKAAERFAIPTADRFYKSALSLIENRLDQDPWKDRFIDVTLKLARITHYAPTPESLKLLTSASELARTRPDRGKYLLVLYWIGRVRYVRGEINKALAICRLCRRLFATLPDSGLDYRVKCLEGKARFFAAHFELSARLLREGIAEAEARNDIEEVVYSYGFLTMDLAFLGRFEESAKLESMILELARNTGNLPRLGATYVQVGFPRHLAGDWAAAIQHQHRAIEIGEAIGATYVVACALAAKGYEDFMAGDSESGLAGMRRGCGLLESSGLILGGQAYRALLGEVCARGGYCEEAVQHAESALLQERLGERHGVPIALRAKAMALSRMDDAKWPEARTAFEASAERAARFSDLPALAIARHEYSVALEAHGESPAAYRESDAAIGLFRRIGMPWWLARAEELRARLKSQLPGSERTDENKATSGLLNS